MVKFCPILRRYYTQKLYIHSTENSLIKDKYRQSFCKKNQFYSEKGYFGSKNSLLPPRRTNLNYSPRRLFFPSKKLWSIWARAMRFD